MTYKLNCTPEQIVEALRAHGLATSDWKGRRLYVRGVGYTTKKMRTNAYIDLATLQISVCVECPSQHSAWIAQREQEVVVEIDPFRRWIRRYCVDRSATATAEILESVQEIQQGLDEIVYGYYTEWRERRVAINGYGKLATRNRNHIQPWSGRKADAPRGFHDTGATIYQMIQNRTIQRGSDGIMLEPYEEAQERVLKMLETEAMDFHAAQRN